MGTKTILLVDDEARVLDFVRVILERAGFTVLAALGPDQAAEMESSFPDRIDVLMSDVLMPGTSGSDLAHQLSARRPEMRIILMSGYTDAHMMRLEPGWDFIRKPFMPSDLRFRLKELLEKQAHVQAQAANHHQAGE